MVIGILVPCKERETGYGKESNATRKKKDQNRAITNGIIKASSRNGKKQSKTKLKKKKQHSFLKNLGGAQVCCLVTLGPTETNLGLLVLRTVTESVPVI